MNEAIRKTVLILAWAALAAGALVCVIGPGWLGGTSSQAVAQPVPAGDEEIVWLNAATNAVGWERFVAAIRRLEDKPELGLSVVDDRNAFPNQSTAVAELAVSVRGSKGRLWFRWYKLTGDTPTSKWVDALMKRQPPPLAIVGGGSSDRARDLAHDLESWRGKTSRPPLLLLTTATAEHVDVAGNFADLMQIYPGHTFRFCFTNRQIAEAVTDFIWSRDELRPDVEPVYFVRWTDDPYSEDLFGRFWDVIGSEPYANDLQRRRVARAAARQWADSAAFATTGGPPPALDAVGSGHTEFERQSLHWFLRWYRPLRYSEGDFSQPGRQETQVADLLLDEYSQHQHQRRPLLIMPANPPSGRRLLRAIVRSAPVEASRFVVASGDAIDFSTIYRDRRLNWQIQDLPFSMVIFCHRNPVDPGAFQPDRNIRRHEVPDPAGKTSTSTQDLLLYEDIVETIAAAAYDGDALRSDVEAVTAAMRKGQWRDGRPRFDDDGNQIGGAGEYVVWLEPVRDGDRVNPRAVMQVWSRGGSGPAGWRLERRLDVDYLYPRSAASR